MHLMESQGMQVSTLSLSQWMYGVGRAGVAQRAEVMARPGGKRGYISKAREPVDPW